MNLRKPSLLSRLRHDDDGATLVLVAVSLIGLFGISMLAVDAGSLLTSRRGVVTDTDAAALGAARRLSQVTPLECVGLLAGNVGVAASEASYMLTENNANTTLVSPADATSGTNPTVTTNGACESGTVRVEGETPGRLFFAPIFGFDEPQIYSSSTAEWGPLTGVKGLRPFGICDKNHHFVEWNTVLPGTEYPSQSDYPGLAGVPLPTWDHPTAHTNGTPYTAAGVVHRLFFDRVVGVDGQCGSAPGNWGWHDYNGTGPGATPNGKDAIKKWLESGYDGWVRLDPHDCNELTAGEEDCNTNTGAGGASISAALDNLVCSGSLTLKQCVEDHDKDFLILVHENVSGTGNNAVYDQLAFLSVVLRGHNKITGNEGGPGGCDPMSNPDPCSYFDLEFVDIQLSGEVGSSFDPGVKSARGIQLCGVGGGAGAVQNEDNCD